MSKQGLSTRLTENRRQFKNRSSLTEDQKFLSADIEPSPVSGMSMCCCHLPRGMGFLSVSVFICLTACSFLSRRDRWGRESLQLLLITGGNTLSYQRTLDVNQCCESGSGTFSWILNYLLRIQIQAEIKNKQIINQN